MRRRDRKNAAAGRRQGTRVGVASGAVAGALASGVVAGGGVGEVSRRRGGVRTPPGCRHAVEEGSPADSSSDPEPRGLRCSLPVTGCLRVVEPAEGATINGSTIRIVVNTEIPAEVGEERRDVN